MGQVRGVAVRRLTLDRLLELSIQGAILNLLPAQITDAADIAPRHVIVKPIFFALRSPTFANLLRYLGQGALEVMEHEYGPGRRSVNPVGASEFACLAGIGDLRPNQFTSKT